MGFVDILEMARSYANLALLWCSPGTHRAAELAGTGVSDLRQRCRGMPGIRVFPPAGNFELLASRSGRRADARGTGPHPGRGRARGMVAPAAARRDPFDQAGRSSGGAFDRY